MRLFPFCPSAGPGFRLRQAASRPAGGRRGDAACQSGHAGDVAADSGRAPVTGEGSAARRQREQEEPRQTQQVG